MAKKEFFLIVDTETTSVNTVYDFGAVVVDRKGNIHAQCAVIVKENLGEELFFDPSGRSLWSRQYANQKKENYNKMLDSGARMIASVGAVNRWLEKVAAKYNPILTAYNVAFDQGKCANTGIDLTMFSNSFCLWHLACETFAHTKNYKNFILQNHYFGNKTERGNMTYKTNAEVMAHFVTGRDNPEPHTALEDAMFFELPILLAIVNKKNWKEKTNKPYNWKEYQLKDNFTAK